MRPPEHRFPPEQVLGHGASMSVRSQLHKPVGGRMAILTGHAATHPCHLEAFGKPYCTQNF